MKYILSILLIAFLSGCSSGPGETAKNICTGVKKCASSISLTKKAAALINRQLKEDTSTKSVSTSSVLERTGEILTW